MAHLDLISDIFQRLAERHAKIPAKVLRDVEADIRADWGGERHYIAKVGESGRAQLEARDRQIHAEHRHGDHDELIARRHGISVKRVRQILDLPGGAPWLPPGSGNALP